MVGLLCVFSVLFAAVVVLVVGCFSAFSVIVLCCFSVVFAAVLVLIDSRSSVFVVLPELVFLLVVAVGVRQIIDVSMRILNFG